MILFLLIFLPLIIGLLVIRLLFILLTIHKAPPLLQQPLTSPRRLLCVAGSGGHTAELLQLLQTLSDHYNPRHYIVATTDTLSQHRIEMFEETRNVDITISKIPRAREVGQSYLTSLLTTMFSQLVCVPYVARARPDIVLVNGPGTCIPVCVFVLVMRCLGLCRGRIVYVESVCRVRTLSLSGKILLYFADHVLVQWPQLAERYTRCEYIGRLS